MQFIYDYKNNQMESSLGKKSVSSLKWTKTIRMLKTWSLMKPNRTGTLSLHSDWMNYSHPTPSNLWRLDILHSISCRQKRKSWLIWNQSLIFIFILLCYSNCGLSLLPSKWHCLPFDKSKIGKLPLLTHSFIYFPLKRKTFPRDFFKWHE
jgi:hypothetical protein